MLYVYTHRNHLAPKTARKGSGAQTPFWGKKIVWACPATRHFRIQSGPIFWARIVASAKTRPNTVGSLTCFRDMAIYLIYVQYDAERSLHICVFF